MVDRVRRWVVSALCLVAGGTMTQGCSGAPSTADVEPVVVHGTVTDADTGLPIAGVGVSVKRWTARTTGDEGEYTVTCELADLEAATALAVDPDGPANGGDYADTEIAFVSDGDGDEQVDIQMRRRP